MRCGGTPEARIKVCGRNRQATLNNVVKCTHCFLWKERHRWQRMSASESPRLDRNPHLRARNLYGELERRPALSREEATDDAVGNIELTGEVRLREAKLLHPRAELVVGSKTRSTHGYNIADRQSSVNRQTKPVVPSSIALWQDAAMEKETRGQRVKRRRLELGLTQQKVGALCGLHSSIISRIEHDERQHERRETIEKLAGALQTTRDWIEKGHPGKPATKPIGLLARFEWPRPRLPPAAQLSLIERWETERIEHPDPKLDDEYWLERLAPSSGLRDESIGTKVPIAKSSCATLANSPAAGVAFL